MSERIRPFAGGVNIELTCSLGLRADVTLIRPEDMDDAQFREYVKISNSACQDCGFRNKFLCNKLDDGGEASVDAFSGDIVNVDITLRELKAPCVQSEVNVIDY
jgi:hypothetical protein